MDAPQTQMVVATHIAEAIRSAGETQMTIAQATGIPQATLSRRLNGLTPFTVAEIGAIASVLGVDYGFLAAPEAQSA